MHLTWSSPKILLFGLRVHKIKTKLTYQGHFLSSYSKPITFKCDYEVARFFTQNLCNHSSLERCHGMQRTRYTCALRWVFSTCGFYTL